MILPDPLQTPYIERFLKLNRKSIAE
ncbi:hypothetical protein Bhyg_09707 [Pseudolycoriella hygida]|uniref:Uncharacterized protein n=1 Tax=Pseudolycoriella hygida TaxID=35572 RepID=A0A9Q0MS51_9DIPT|nr:hypothetical protein Bhyg_09707 [Pseudolycoriella hygida]